MTTEFSLLNLRPELEQAVAELGYETMMPIQSAIIPTMISKRDVVGQAQTGTGKTAAFALPILQNLEAGQNHIQALVMAPTRELALQVAKAITAYGKLLNVRVLAVYGGQPYGPQIGNLRRGVDVVVGTPGRLIDLMDRKVLDLSQVRTVVLDEADEMLSMGFVEDMETILAQTPAERQTALFSATLSNDIRRLAEKYMKDPFEVTIQREQLTVEAIEQRYYMVYGPDKLAALTRLIEMEEISSALIFARTRGATGELASELTVRGYPAEVLNGDLSQDTREATLNRFRQNQIKVLVATDVAARGLDIEGISHVFNFDLPEDPEVYIHRIGRTGRAGKTGIAISLLTPAETRRLRQIEHLTRKKIQRATLPTEDEIRARREDIVMNQLKMWLRRGRCLHEKAVVESMIAEGMNPVDIAAAALKMARAEEKQRPIAPVTEVPEYKAEPRPARREGERMSSGQNWRESSRGPRDNARGGRDGGSRDGGSENRGENTRPSGRGRRSDVLSHEQGMVRLSMDKGWKHGIRPNDIVGAIAAHTGIPGSVIGRINIEEAHSMVDVPEEFVTIVLEKSGEVRIRRLPIALSRAA